MTITVVAASGHVVTGIIGIRVSERIGGLLPITQGLFVRDYGFRTPTSQ